MTNENETEQQHDTSRSHSRELYTKYDLKEILGKGVSSIVRRGIQKSSGREFAVKMIEFGSEETDEQKALKESTLREISILKELNGHANIINLQEEFLTPHNCFIVFEICRGGELFDYLTRVVHLSERKTRNIMTPILQAVKYMHEKNIVHRDLKPENILLDEHHQVKITDFGFAECVRNDESLRDLCGTPGYLAPEVLSCSMNTNSKGYGRPVDMWACGVIMYTLMSGSPPFWHRKQLTMLRMIMKGNYTFDGAEWLDATDASKDLIRQMLTVNPKKRINATEALNHHFLAGANTDNEKKFKARFVLRSKLIAIMFIVAMKHQRLQPRIVKGEDIIADPYRYKTLRKIIDGGAFFAYGHWVKRGDQQNRAALFEMENRRTVLQTSKA
ncbi:hypothetical protein SNEBB_001642 [Seison nebaliae]|nr:hypothetical protein SNEBB_001642 [Seison nebaliae]